MANKYVGYIYNDNKELVKQGELVFHDTFTTLEGITLPDIWEMKNTIPKIIQGDNNTTQIVGAVPNDKYPDEQPFITIVTPKNWKTGLLPMTKASKWIVTNAGVVGLEDVSRYKVATIDLDLIGTTIYGGIHGFSIGWLGNGSFDNLSGSTYIVDDGVNDYENVDTDVYSQLYATIDSTASAYANRLVSLEDWANDNFSYTEGQTPGVRKAVFYNASGTAVLTYNGTNLILNRNAIDEEVLTVLNELTDLSDVDITTAANDNLLVYNGVNWVNITKAAFLADLQAEVNSHSGDIVDLQTDKEDVANKIMAWGTPTHIQYPSAKLTKNTFDTKVDKSQTIIGLDLQDNILLDEFKTALGNATQSVAGLLSAEDKTHLDGLVALLETSDGNNVVDTIGEILEIFQNYPEGADLVTVLQGKVDMVVGKGLSTNDFTDLLKDHYNTAYAHSQIVGANPHETKFADILDKPTTIEQAGILNVYNKEYIDALKDKNGWESELLGTLSNNGTITLAIINQYDEIQMYAKDTLGVIDNENIRPGLMQSGDSVYFFDDTQTFIMVDTVFGFYAPAGYTLQVVGLKYTDFTAEEVSTNELGVTVQDKLVELDSDNTQNKADIQTINLKDAEQDRSIKTIEETLRKSNSGEVTAEANGTDIISLGVDVANAPLGVKMEGLLLDSEQLVTNGDFSDGTTGWTVGITGNSIAVVDGVLEYTFTTTLQSLSSEFLRTTDSIITNTDKIYTAVMIKGDKISQYRVGIGNTFPISANITTSWQLKSLIHTSVSNTSFFLFTDANTSLALNDKIYIQYAYTFNISTLIANKQYSPLYDDTFDLISDAEIKAQMDLWVQDGTLPNSIMSVDMDKRVTSVGKNLFDVDNIVFVKGRIETDGSIGNVANTTAFSIVNGVVQYTTLGGGITSNYINVKPNTNYVYSIGTSSQNTVTILASYDENDNLVLRNAFTSSAKTGSINVGNATKLRINFRTDTVGTFNVYEIQIEEATTATTYEPHRSSSIYLDSGEVGYSLPNGVKDSIEFRNGQAYHVQRVKKYTLQASDIIDIISNYTYAPNIQVVQIKKPLDFIGYNLADNLSHSKAIFIKNFISDGTTVKNHIFEWSGTLMALSFELGTYASLAEAQADLAGTEIYYQLAIPTETPISVIGNAMAYPNGTFLIEDVVRRIGVYSSGITVDKAISKLDNIYKLNDDGSSTKLAVSGATVAGDGLSFTHTSLSNGDFVWFDYFYQGTNVKGLSTVYYYGDKLIVADTTTGTVYKIIFTIDDGVITVDKVAV